MQCIRVPSQLIPAPVLTVAVTQMLTSLRLVVGYNHTLISFVLDSIGTRSNVYVVLPTHCID